MIIKGSQRAGGRALALHLLNVADNDFVDVHAIHGFIADDVQGAFLEVEAQSRATKCRQPYFSVSLSAPREATVMDADYEAAIDEIATRLGLANQPRVVLFHEKEGRRHCHVVFSRITDEMRAVALPFFKEKLVALSREQYLAHGWDLPAGLVDRSLRDPTNFSLEEWQVAKRADRDPREIKQVLKQCWARADGSRAFAAALRHHGFWLCRGDRRGFVAMDYLGNVFSLSRWLDVKSKDLKKRLGEAEKLPGTEETTQIIKSAMTDLSVQLGETVRSQKAAALAPLIAERRKVVLQQRAARESLVLEQARERADAVRANTSMRRKGLLAIFDWVTGRRARLRRVLEQLMNDMKQNQEASLLLLRRSQLAERAPLQERLRQTRAHFAKLQFEALPYTGKDDANQRSESRPREFDQELEP